MIASPSNFCSKSEPTKQDRHLEITTSVVLSGTLIDKALARPLGITVSSTMNHHIIVHRTPKRANLIFIVGKVALDTVTPAHKNRLSRRYGRNRSGTTPTMENQIPNHSSHFFFGKAGKFSGYSPNAAAEQFFLKGLIDSLQRKLHQTLYLRICHSMSFKTKIGTFFFIGGIS